MSRTQIVYLSLSLLLVVLSNNAAVRNRGRTDRASHQKLGRYTEQQAFEISRPIFANFVSLKEDLYLSAEPCVSTSRNGTIQRLWSVDGTDRQYRSTLHLVWDADTGQLREVGCDCFAHRSPAHPNHLTAEGAAEKARDWLSLLGFSETWSVSEPPERNGVHWGMTLQGDHRKAMIVIRDTNGGLDYAGIEQRH